MDKKEAKRSNQRWIIAVIIVVVIIVGVVFFALRNRKNTENVQENEILYNEEADGTKINTSKKLSEEKQIEGLRITNIELTYRENVSYLKADVINTKEEKNGDFNVNLKIVDQNGQEIYTMIGYIPSVQAGEKTILDSAITADIAGAYNFEISKAAE